MGDADPDWGCTFLKRSKEKCLRRLQSNLRGLVAVHKGAAIFVGNSGFTGGFLLEEGEVRQILYGCGR